MALLSILRFLFLLVSSFFVLFRSLSCFLLLNFLLFFTLHVDLHLTSVIPLLRYLLRCSILDSIEIRRQLHVGKLIQDVFLLCESG
jgi:hypothetical protein